MNTPKIEAFLEKSDMNYLFCLLSKLEIQRINTLPSHVKQRFPEKITVMAMEHVAENEVPDYITEIAEAELAMAQESSPFQEDDMDFDSEEETIDDSSNFIQDMGTDDLDNYDDDDEDDDSDADDDND